MANVAVVIELADGRPLPGCLEVLGQARRVCSALGATLYAVVPIGQTPSHSEDELIGRLQSGGADRVVLITDETLGGGGRALGWSGIGPALAQVSDLLSPILLLFLATRSSREVAARAAARIGAAFLSEASVEVEDGELSLRESTGTRTRTLEGEIDFPVVATVRRGSYSTAHGDDEAEVEILNLPGRSLAFEEIGWESDPAPRCVVRGPTGDAAPAEDALDRLAQALGGRVERSLPKNAPVTISIEGELEITLGLHGQLDAGSFGRGAGEPEPGPRLAVEGAALVLAEELASALREDGR